MRFGRAILSLLAGLLLLPAAYGASAPLDCSAFRLLGWMAPEASEASRAALGILPRGGRARISGRPGPHATGLVEAEISRVSSELLAGFHLPDTVKVDGSSIRGSFNYETGEIFVARLGATATSLSKTQVATLVHEYAHQVFMLNMARHSPTWAERYPSFIAAQKGAGPATLDSLRPYGWVSAAKEEISGTMAHQELFADLVGVLHLRDPSAFIRSGEERDFSGSLLGASWSRREVHDTFAPLRRLLWDRYFSRPENQGRWPEILSRVFDVIAEDAAAMGPPGPGRPRPEQMNLRLGNLLAERLAEFGP